MTGKKKKKKFSKEISKLKFDADLWLTLVNENKCKFLEGTNDHYPPVRTTIYNSLGQMEGKIFEKLEVKKKIFFFLAQNFSGKYEE